MQVADYNSDNESKYGKSIGVIRDNSSTVDECQGGCYKVNVENIVKTNADFAIGTGFIYDNMSVNYN